MNGDTLFGDAELFSGDPLLPDLDQVCPPELIADLSPAQHELRVERLIEQAHWIVDKAWEVHAAGRMRAAWCVLFSGGNDSTVLAHLMKDRVDYAVHIDTTIGIPETQQFVRDTCAAWGLDLIVQQPPVPYEELVIQHAFPGPAFHYWHFQRLKERALDIVRAELVTNPRRERLLNIAGRRRSESKRRRNIPLYEPDGSAIWASPIAMWTKEDMVKYRAMKGDVPFNPVTDHIGMSGECLCGAFAKPGELDRLRIWYPNVADRIDQIAAKVKAAGHPEPRCRWGHGEGRRTEQTGRLCTSCDINQLDMFDEGAA